MHKIQQRQLPLVLLGAGLPILPGLAGDPKSFAERLFGFPDIGPLTATDAAKSLQYPAKVAGVAFESAALDEIFRLTSKILPGLRRTKPFQVTCESCETKPLRQGKCSHSRRAISWV
jgi:hypothetical protein